MSPRQAKYMAKAAKGYEEHKKDKATNEMSARLASELFPAIAAGQVASLVHAGVIEKDKQKEITKKYIKRHGAALQKN